MGPSRACLRRQASQPAQMIMELKHFLSITDLDTAAMKRIFTMAATLKHSESYKTALAGNTMVMLFEKPSLRTRVSFEVGMTQLGGHAVYLGPDDIGLGTRESVSDVAKVASSMGDVMMARVFSHSTIYELAKHSRVPVINGLSDWEHPCQALADLFTILEVKKKLGGLKIAFIGDGENNIAHSLVLASAQWGMNICIASPKGYEVKSEILLMAQNISIQSGGNVFLTDDPQEAVRGADVVYTDTWVSMGDEADKSTRLCKFLPYQVNSWLMSLAKRDAVFMHDLPAYRGQEVTADVIDGAQSIVFHQAENRLHVQKALMLWLLGCYHGKSV